MSNTTKDGGAAFPSKAFLHHTPEGHLAYHAGMTLRDWFAGQALTGLASDAGYSVEATASIAYRVADAMLAARKGGDA